MLEISNVNVQSPRFKASSQMQAPQMQLQPMGRDTFELMHAQKKEKSKDNWMKAGVLAGVACAVIFGIQALTGRANLKIAKEVAEKRMKALEAQTKVMETQNTRLTKEIERLVKDMNKTGESAKEASEEGVQKLKDSFVDLSKNDNIVGIDDPSLTESFRKWADDVVKGANAPTEVSELFGEASPNMIFMHGGSGVGKTYNADVILKALGAQRTKKQFSNFSSKYVGETSVEITKFFNEIEKLLQENPDKRYGIVFDEFETLAHDITKLGEGREHLKENRTAMLNGIDQVRKYKNFYMVASSNVGIKGIDEAIARRFGQNLEIEYPNQIALKASLKTQLKNFGIVKDDFFTSQEKEINAFLDEVYRRHGGHGDIENIAKSAINKSKTKFMDRCVAEGAMDANYKVIDKAKFDKLVSESKFETNDLVEALNEIGKLAGERQNIPNP